jgi:hypothetical protein
MAAPLGPTHPALYGPFAHVAARSADGMKAEKPSANIKESGYHFIMAISSADYR